MRLQPLIRALLANSLLFCISPAHAQYNTTDSLSYLKAKQQAIAFYHTYVKDESGLYNGSQYVVYAQTIQEGIPFFETPEPSKGNVVYTGVLYENVPLLYDILKGQLITLIPSSNYLICLNADKVSNFEILNHKFTRLIKDSGDKTIKTGFYEVLHDGQTTVYKKQTKTVGEDLSQAKLRNFIVESNTFYIKKTNTFYTVSNKKSLLTILKDRKKEVQEFIKKNKLDIRNDKDNALPKIAAFYDSLSTIKNP
ncbi:hypothetical protein FRZ67_01875 [Panacibacter ginsenosidivorans]|uniref:GLPGLI family protein n=1 Tax=Panacibacter ginsenosidivorans TaxID=1813871 RepID=A0A5B8V5U0_9BACT|nr:hypothetical protein [Panacibacter ginsenosidivorans]QEC66111.1 hypothetical protein FRZ67_01875 [Panacibacter ginsenosidivorans]